MVAVPVLRRLHFTALRNNASDEQDRKRSVSLHRKFNTGRKPGPFWIPAVLSDVFRAAIGQVRAPRLILPCCSVSVLNAGPTKGGLAEPVMHMLEPEDKTA